jgi:hypothetical protein
VLLAVEGFNVALPMWRYVFLPDRMVVRVIWWLGFAGGGALWLGGVSRLRWTDGPAAEGAGEPGEVASLTARGAQRDILSHFVVGVAWLIVMLAASAWVPGGPRLNTLRTASTPWMALVPVGMLLWTVTVPHLARVGRRGGGAGWTVGGGVAVAAAWALVSWGTVASVTPRIRDLPGVLPSHAESIQLFGYPTPESLAKADPTDLIRSVPAVPEEELERVRDVARLAMHRGMGTRFSRALAALEIGSPEELANWDEGHLVGALNSVEASPPRRAWVRSWLTP